MPVKTTGLCRAASILCRSVNPDLLNTVIFLETWKICFSDFPHSIETDIESVTVFTFFGNPLKSY